MATIQRLKLGPADHGRPISETDLREADVHEGYKYELIDGRLYVSHMPNLPTHGRWTLWLFVKLFAYGQVHPEIINFVHFGSRVFIPQRRRPTSPEPDVAAYENFPLELPAAAVNWQDISPVLVAEVLSPDGLDKDLVRNPRLYLQVPSIREYWIVNALEDADRPSVRILARQGRKWRTREFAPGVAITSRTLPGFDLVFDLHS